MNAIQLPELFYPMLPCIHPLTAQVESSNLQRWAHRLGISPHGKDASKLAACQFAYFIGRCHPSATLEDLELAVDFTTWLFLWDDQFDQRVEGKLAHPSWVAAQNALALEILAGASPGAGSSSLLWALAELREPLARRMPASLIPLLSSYFDATVGELELRRSGACPDVNTYIRMRLLTSGVLVMCPLIEMAEHAPLPPQAWESHTLQQLLEAANKIMGWSNDLFSLQSDLEDAGHLNLVFSLQCQQGLELQKAVEAAAEMHNAEVCHFLQLERQLQDVAGDRAATGRFVQGLRRWIRANLDWSLLTGRYRGEASAASANLSTLH